MLKCEGREVRGRKAQEQEEIFRDGKRGRVYTVAPRAGVNNTIFVPVILQRKSIMLALWLLGSACHHVYFKTESMKYCQ